MARALRWIVGLVIVTAGAGILAFSLSPWPSVAIIRWVFANEEKAAQAALERHVPPGITTRRDIAYGPGRDERLDLYTPSEPHEPAGGTAARPTIVWVHGGGFVAGSKDGVANYMRILAGRGYTAIAVAYSTGAGYPTPVAQVNAALGFIAGNADSLEVDPGRLVLAGSSAGAHIASQVALLTTEPAYAGLVGIAPRLQAHSLSALALMSGVFDPDALNFDGPFGWFLRTVLWAYMGVRDLGGDPRLDELSIVAHVTPRFPPSFVSSGNADPLEPQAVALAERLGQLGVRVDALFFPPDREPPLPHEFQFNLDDPAGREALERMLAFLADVRAADGEPSVP